MSIGTLLGLPSGLFKASMHNFIETPSRHPASLIHMRGMLGMKASAPNCVKLSLQGLWPYAAYFSSGLGGAWENSKHVTDCSEMCGVLKAQLQG